MERGGLLLAKRFHTCHCINTSARPRLDSNDIVAFNTRHSSLPVCRIAPRRFPNYKLPHFVFQRSLSFTFFRLRLFASFVDKCSRVIAFVVSGKHLYHGNHSYKKSHLLSHNKTQLCNLPTFDLFNINPSMFCSCSFHNKIDGVFFWRRE